MHLRQMFSYSWEIFSLPSIVIKKYSFLFFSLVFEAYFIFFDFLATIPNLSREKITLSASSLLIVTYSKVGLSFLIEESQSNNAARKLDNKFFFPNKISLGMCFLSFL